VGCELHFKCENFQKVGAFKYRGATNAVLQLSAEELKQGVATHSSGNHGQALAKAAKIANSKAYIVMPNNAPKVKIEAVKGYGAEVIFCEPTLEARETTLQKVIDQTGAVFIHPYNNYDVIAGQATCAKELINQVDGLQIILAPVGGGGLLSGTLLSAYYFAPNIEVWAGEPENVNDALLSLKRGEIVEAPITPTIADGLKTSLGDKTFPIIQEHIYGILTVTEEEIVDAMKLIWQYLKIIVEPSCAVPLAAIIKNPVLFHDKKVGVILTGGNVDLEKLPF
jgi:threonine dehydratase